MALKSLADRFRIWYDYERDCNSKTMQMLESVPESQRNSSSFQKAVDRLAHLIHARLRWLHRLGHWPEMPKPFPENTLLSDLPAMLRKTEDAWVDYLHDLDDEKLKATIEWVLPDGKQYRLNLEAILTQTFGHAWYHRGQIAQLVAVLGGKAVDTDYIFYCLANPDKMI